MDKYEKVGYALLIMVVGSYLVAMFLGLLALLPYGFVGLLLLLSIGVFMTKVVKERLANKEDDYYSKKVEK